ncbi:hypothetical protein B7P43_G13309 [Cryptotermes secundus]|uniref:Uncharacterized protein n=1 Tax=Cryptotermes secundus TaxID=105785 RepID=A0A2J7R722_9NEOP|nr:hypothetical protein B7P43_G13309 [Cryptotermes secundus]
METRHENGTRELPVAMSTNLNVRAHHQKSFVPLGHPCLGQWQNASSGVRCNTILSKYFSQSAGILVSLQAYVHNFFGDLMQ